MRTRTVHTLTKKHSLKSTQNVYRMDRFIALNICAIFIKTVQNKHVKNKEKL